MLLPPDLLFHILVMYLSPLDGLCVFLPYFFVSVQQPPRFNSNVNFHYYLCPKGGVHCC